MKRLLIVLVIIVPLASCSPKAEEPLATFAEYQQIKNGMTLAEVEAIVGASGDRRGGTENSAGYSWMNKDGTGLVVSFENGKVYDKATNGSLQ